MYTLLYTFVGYTISYHFEGDRGGGGNLISLSSGEEILLSNTTPQFYPSHMKNSKFVAPERPMPFISIYIIFVFDFSTLLYIYGTLAPGLELHV